MKLLLTCFITPFLLLSHSVLADSAKQTSADSLDFGIAYKRYSINLPSRASSSEDDDANEFSALALIASDDFNEYVSISFEAAKGLAEANSGYDFTVAGIDINERYTAQLDYSLSVSAKFRLLPNTALHPFLLLSGNTTAISYDYQRKVADEVSSTDSKTLTSSGINYGAGLEFVTDDNVKLLLSYENLSHIKYDTYSLSFDLVFDF